VEQRAGGFSPCVESQSESLDGLRAMSPLTPLQMACEMDKTNMQATEGDDALFGLGANGPGG
jgi:hypothetical protein